MRILIERLNDTIITHKNFKDLERGEIAHIIAEIELLKQELLCRWESYDDEEGGKE